MTEVAEQPKYTKEQLRAMLEETEAQERKAAQEAEKQYKADKIQFLATTSEEFIQLNGMLAKLKGRLISDANGLYERMYEIKGKPVPDRKSFSLKSENVKITVDRQERFEFTDEAMVHINAIKEIFHDKFAERNKGLYAILDGLLIKGTKGEYDPKLLAKARRQVRELGDQKLIEEFDKLDECQVVTGSSMYCRCHIRTSENKWQELSLNFSSL